ncbi:MAG TPA: hypothetical protein VGE67_14300 [Haloferula sp.]
MKEEELELPVGVRVTVIFLRTFSILVFPLALLACLVSMATLFMISFQGDLIAGAFMTSGVSLGACLALMMMALCCDWFARHLRATATMSPLWSARFPRPMHPARQIFLPPLGFVMGYSFLAVLMWLPSTFHTPPAVSWPWPVAWIVIGIGAMYLFHLLEEYTP